jgi:hypothetical protein
MCQLSNWFGGSDGSRCRSIRSTRPAAIGLGALASAEGGATANPHPIIDRQPQC